MIVEFVGTPGAGKTTLVPAIIDFLREKGLCGFTVLEAARPYAQRTWLGKTISLLPSVLQRPLLWQVFYWLSARHRLQFRNLISHVRNQLSDSSASPDLGLRRVQYWFEHLAGYYGFLTSQQHLSEALVFDDGFIHRVVHLFASDSERPDPQAVAAYLDLIPQPDLVIVARSPLRVCTDRVYKRGIWDHSRHKSPEEVQRFLANSEYVVNMAVDHIKGKGWKVIEVYSGSDDPNQTIMEMRNKLNKITVFPQKPISPVDESIGLPTVASTPRFPYMPRPSRLSAYFNSRSRPLDIELDTVEAVLTHYELRLVEPPSNLPLSRRTRNIIVNTHVGKKVLKCYRSMLPTSSIIYGHSILNRLAELKFPASWLVKTPSDAHMVSHDGWNYAVLDFIEGTNYSLNFLLPAHRLKLMVIAGQTLARFHMALDGFIPEGVHHLGFSSQTGNWNRDMIWHICKVDELKEQSCIMRNENDIGHANWLVQNCNYILDELEKLDESLRAVPLPRLVIHGDYGLHNLVFPKDAPVAMLDFETARLEWRLSDLVSALSRLRFANGTYNFESIKSFLTGYQSVFPISKKEWYFLPLVWRFYKLRSALIYWNSYFETGGPVRKLISARDAVGQADWVLQHPGRLLNLNMPVSG